MGGLYFWPKTVAVDPAELAGPETGTVAIDPSELAGPDWEPEAAPEALPPPVKPPVLAGHPAARAFLGTPEEQAAQARVASPSFVGPRRPEVGILTPEEFDASQRAAQAAGAARRATEQAAAAQAAAQAAAENKRLAQEFGASKVVPPLNWNPLNKPRTESIQIPIEQVTGPLQMPQTKGEQYWEWLNKPLPGLAEAAEDTGFLVGPFDWLHRTVLKTGAGLTSPLMLGFGALTGGLGDIAATQAPAVANAARAVQTGISTYFAGDMGHALVERWPELSAAWDHARQTGDYYPLLKTGGEELVTAILAGMATLHATGEGAKIGQEINRAVDQGIAAQNIEADVRMGQEREQGLRQGTDIERKAQAGQQLVDPFADEFAFPLQPRDAPLGIPVGPMTRGERRLLSEPPAEGPSIPAARTMAASEERAATRAQQLDAIAQEISDGRRYDELAPEDQAVVRQLAQERLAAGGEPSVQAAPAPAAEAPELTAVSPPETPPRTIAVPPEMLAQPEPERQAPPEPALGPAPAGQAQPPGWWPPQQDLRPTQPEPESPTAGPWKVPQPVDRYTDPFAINARLQEINDYATKHGGVPEHQTAAAAQEWKDLVARRDMLQERQQRARTTAEHQATGKAALEDIIAQRPEAPTTTAPPAEAPPAISPAISPTLPAMRGEAGEMREPAGLPTGVTPREETLPAPETALPARRGEAPPAGHPAARPLARTQEVVARPDLSRREPGEGAGLDFLQEIGFSHGAEDGVTPADARKHFDELIATDTNGELSPPTYTAGGGEVRTPTKAMYKAYLEGVTRGARYRETGEVEPVPQTIDVAGHPAARELAPPAESGGYVELASSRPGVEPLKVRVQSADEASAAVRRYIDRQNLGASEWSGGDIRDNAGNLVARVSYNGRVWDATGNMLQEQPGMRLPAAKELPAARVPEPPAGHPAARAGLAREPGAPAEAAAPPPTGPGQALPDEPGIVKRTLQKLDKEGQKAQERLNKRPLLGANNIDPATARDVAIALAGDIGRGLLKIPDIIKRLRERFPNLRPGALRQAAQQVYDTGKAIYDTAHKDVLRRTMEDLDVRIDSRDRVVSPNPRLTIDGKKFSTLDLEKPSEGYLPFKRDPAQAQADVLRFWKEAINESEAPGGTMAAEAVRTSGARPPTAEFWDKSFSLPQRARFWYELSSEGFAGDHVDLLPHLQRRFIDTTAGTSGGVEPRANLRRSIGILSEDLQRVPVMTDLRDPASARRALSEKEITTLKFGSFSGTMKYLANLVDKKPLTTNDVQVASMFGTTGDMIGRNPILYEVLSRFFMKLRDAQNAELEGTHGKGQFQPWETWQMQAPSWVYERIRKDPSKANEYDDYAQVFPGVLAELRRAGIPTPGGKLTLETLMDPRTPDVMSSTRPKFIETPTATIRMTTGRTPAGRAAAEHALALRGMDQSIPFVKRQLAAYDAIQSRAMRRIAQRKTVIEIDPVTGEKTEIKLPSLLSELGTAITGRKIDMSRLDWDGYEVDSNGNLERNLRIPMAGTHTKDGFIGFTEPERKAFLSVLGQQFHLDSVEASHFGTLDADAEGPTYSVFVHHYEAEGLAPEKIKEFSRRVGYEIKAVDHPNGTVLSLDIGKHLQPDGSFTQTPDLEGVQRAIVETFGADADAEIVHKSFAKDAVTESEYQGALDAYKTGRKEGVARAGATAYRKRDIVRVENKLRRVFVERDAKYGEWADATAAEQAKWEGGKASGRPGRQFQIEQELRHAAAERAAGRSPGRGTWGPEIYRRTHEPGWWKEEVARPAGAPGEPSRLEPWKPERFSARRGGALEPGPRLTQQHVEDAFPGADVIDRDTHYEVTLPNGTRIHVEPDATISIPEEAVPGYGGKLGPGDVVQGGFRRLEPGDVDALIKVTAGEHGPGTMRHEALHAAMRMALDPGEMWTVLRDHGLEDRGDIAAAAAGDAAAAERVAQAEESAAEAYRTWEPRKQPDTMFEKIRDFFTNIYRTFRPNAERVFERLHEGEPWTRERAGHPAARRLAERAGEAEPERYSVKRPAEREAEDVPIEERHINFRRMQLSPEEDANLREETRQAIQEYGLEPKEVESHEQIKKEVERAFGEGSDLSKYISAEDVGIKTRAARHAIKLRINALNREVVAINRESLNPDLPSGEVAALEKKMAAKEADLQSMIGEWSGIRSADGRNLAMHNMMAGSDWDLTYWLSRAKRAKRADLDLEQHKKIRELVADGERAQEELQKALDKAKGTPDDPEAVDNAQEAVNAAGRQVKRIEEDIARTESILGETAALKEKVSKSKGTMVELAQARREALAEGRRAAREGTKFEGKIPEAEAAHEEAIRKRAEAEGRTLLSKQRVEDLKRQQEVAQRDLTRAKARLKTSQESYQRLLDQRENVLAGKPRYEALKKDVDLAKQKLAKEINELDKAGFLKTLTYIVRGGMLTLPKGALQDVVGTYANVAGLEQLARLPATALDSLLSLRTGHRTETLPDLQTVTDMVRNVGKGHQAAMAAMRGTGGVVTEKLSEQHRELVSEHKWLQKPANLASKVYRFRGAIDNYSKIPAYQEAMRTMGKLEAMQKVKAGELTRDQINAYANRYMLNPTEAAKTQAAAVADYQVFQNETNMYRGWRSFVRHFGSVGQAVAEMNLPFMRATTAIGYRAAEYTGGTARLLYDPKTGKSPLKQIIDGSLTKEQQSLLVHSFGRGVVGPSVVALGFMLAKNGVLTGPMSEQSGQRNLEEAAGRTPVSIKTPWGWQSIGQLAPLGNLMAIGANLYEQAFGPLKDEGKRAEAVGGGLIRSILEQPYFQGAQQLLDFATHPTREARRYASNLATTPVPAIVGAVAAATDTEARDIKGETFGEQVGQTLQSKIPGWRQQLPERKTALGGTVPQPGLSRLIWPNTPDVTAGDPMLREAVKLRVPLSKPMIQLGEPREVFRTRQNVRGQLERLWVEDLMSDPNYESATPESRREAFREAMTQAQRALTNVTSSDEYKDADLTGRIHILQQAAAELRP